MSLARDTLTATGNTSFGYFGGGYPGPRSTVDRIDYSNDTATAVEKGPLSSARYSAAATGNQDFGYFAGGRTPSPISTIDRIDYSNDTATASPKGPFSVARDFMSATGTADFGYFGGGTDGSSSTSKVERLDYSNDTSADRTDLTIARHNTAAAGNAAGGYFAGGDVAGGSPNSAIDRVQYNNDTATASPKGPLSETKYGLAGTSSRDYGIPTTTLVNYASGTLATPNKGYFFGGWAVNHIFVDLIILMMILQHF